MLRIARSVLLFVTLAVAVGSGCVNILLRALPESFTLVSSHGESVLLWLFVVTTIVGLRLLMNAEMNAEKKWLTYKWIVGLPLTVGIAYSALVTLPDLYLNPYLSPNLSPTDDGPNEDLHFLPGPSGRSMIVMFQYGGGATTADGIGVELRRDYLGLLRWRRELFHHDPCGDGELGWQAPGELLISCFGYGEAQMTTVSLATDD